MHRAAADARANFANATPLCGTTRTDSRSDGCAAIAAEADTRVSFDVDAEWEGEATAAGSRSRATSRAASSRANPARRSRKPSRSTSWETPLGHTTKSLERGGSSSGSSCACVAALLVAGLAAGDVSAAVRVLACALASSASMTRRRRSHPPRNRLVVATPPSSAPSPSGSSPTVSSARAAAEARANLTYATPLSPSTRTDRTSPNDEKRSRSSDSATPRPHTTNSRECGGRVVSDIVTRRGRTDRAVARYATASAAVRTPSMNARGSNPGDETRCVTSPYFGSGFFLRRLTDGGISVRRARVSPRMLHRGHVLPSYT